MVTRFEIATRAGQRDPRGEEVAHKIRSFLGIPIERVTTCEVYRLDGRIDAGEARRVLHELVDPVLQHGALGRLDVGTFDVVVGVGYKPGVTDPVGKSARVAIEDTLGRRLEDDDVHPRLAFAQFHSGVRSAGRAPFYRESIRGERKATAGARQQPPPRRWSGLAISPACGAGAAGRAR